MTLAEEIFDGLRDVLEAEPQRAAHVRYAYQFQLSGQGGGWYYVDLRGEKPVVSAGSLSDPDCTLSLSVEDFRELVAGRLNPVSAFLSARMRIRGDVSLAMLLKSFIPYQEF